MTSLTDVSATAVHDTYNAHTCLLSIILPTRNESGNVAPLLARIAQALAGVSLEVIFVDDSTDDTPDEIRRQARASSLPVRLIARPPGQRPGGLGGAVIAGMRAAQGRWYCVMDADLQHPPETIVKLLAHAQDTNSDLVVASRFAVGASTPGLGPLRSAISHSFILSARVLFYSQLKRITDPLTGFFLIRRDKFDLDRLRPSGFKILLELIVQFPHLTISEIGFDMAPRNAGDSKASVEEVVRYFRKLIELRMTLGDARFLRFLFVGFSGLFVNSAALLMFTNLFMLHYLPAAAAATQVSTTWNFLLSEVWVFKSQRKQGSVVVRACGFFIVNNLLLLLRSPVMSFLVEAAHFNYVIANIVTLMSATLLRYAFAKKVLWSPIFGRKPSRSITSALEHSEAAAPIQ